MDDQKQLLEKLQSANNILVTVSSNPSVDQLAACVGLTLALNKLDKHATAVFSGDIPDTIEFLKPEETLEKNTDSLRDFIIALDKSKADKLRYKVEDRVVKIFITPYRTSINSEDLIFSQGDFNVDIVVALGVHEQQDLDQAITAHGRILHDATVVAINNSGNNNLGSINWQDDKASSLSEQVTALVKQLGKKLIDEQIATALLTGIVAETDRFRNDNTSAHTMSVSADLMSAGANQQLVTSQLEHTMELQRTPQPAPESQQQPPQDETKQGQEKPDEPPRKKPDDGTLEIEHQKAEKQSADQPADKQKETSPDTTFDVSQFTESEADLAALLNQEPDHKLPDIHAVKGHPEEGKEPVPYELLQADHKPLTQPPAFGGAMSSNGTADPENYDPSMDPLSPPPTNNHQLLSHESPKPPTEEPATLDTSHISPPPASEPKPEPTFEQKPEPPVTETPPPPPVPTPPPAPSQPTPTPTPPPPPPATTPPSTPPPSPSSPQPVSSPESPHSSESKPDVDAARDEVMRALSEQENETLPPIAALNAQPLGDTLHVPAPAAPAQPSPQPPLPPQQADTHAPAPQSPADQPLDMPLPPSNGLNVPPPQASSPTNAPATSGSPNSPPPVPPPMMPPTWPGAPKQ